MGDAVSLRAEPSTDDLRPERPAVVRKVFFHRSGIPQLFVTWLRKVRTEATTSSAGSDSADSDSKDANLPAVFPYAPFRADCFELGDDEPLAQPLACVVQKFDARYELPQSSLLAVFAQARKRGAEISSNRLRRVSCSIDLMYNNTIALI